MGTPPLASARPLWVLSAAARLLVFLPPGFVTLESWLGENDALFLIRDRAEPLVVLPWASWERLVGKR